MLNFLCAESASPTTIVIYVVLIIALLFILIAPFFTQKKKNKEYQNMLGSLKVGDLVKTAGGVIGRITKITDKGDIKTVILETGSKTEKSYMEFDIGMIYCLLKSSKTEQVETEETDVETKTEEPQMEEPKTEAETAETNTEETVTEEKPKKKRTSVTSSKKKTK